MFLFSYYKAIMPTVDTVPAAYLDGIKPEALHNVINFD